MTQRISENVLYVKFLQSPYLVAGAEEILGDAGGSAG